METVIVSKYHRLRARPHAEFVEDIRHMIAHCLFTDRKARSNLCVTQPFSDQCQHFSLARG
jgi:hypothetical protein